jgi:hypothetical protein
VGKQLVRTHYRFDLIKEPHDITELLAKIRNKTVTLVDQIPNHKIPEQPFYKEKEFRLSEHEKKMRKWEKNDENLRLIPAILLFI